MHAHFFFVIQNKETEMNQSGKENKLKAVCSTWIFRQSRTVVSCCWTFILYSSLGLRAEKYKYCVKAWDVPELLFF